MQCSGEYRGHKQRANGIPKPMPQVAKRPEGMARVLRPKENHRRL